MFLDSSGKELKTEASVATLPGVENTLGPEEIAEIDFQPLGKFSMVEALRPNMVSNAGVHLPFGDGDQPVYRVLRRGSVSAHGDLYRPFQRGTLVFSRADRLIDLYHTILYPGTDEKRFIMLLDMTTVEGTWIGHEWADAPPEITDMALASERRIGAPMRDFEQDYIEACHTHMLSPDEAVDIDLNPIGGNIVVENAPVKNITGSIHTPDNMMPLYRVLKVPLDKSGFPEHLRFLEAGDVLMLQGADLRRIIPHNFKGHDELPRRIFMAQVGNAIGWYPTLGWRSPSFKESIAAKTSGAVIHTIGEATTCSEQGL